MRRIVACAGLGTGLGGLRVYPLSLFRPRHCAGGNARNQNAVVLARGSPSAIVCNHDGLQEPVMAHVSITDFLTKFIGRRILRIRMQESSVVAPLCHEKSQLARVEYRCARHVVTHPGTVIRPAVVGPPLATSPYGVPTSPRAPRRCAAAPGPVSRAQTSGPTRALVTEGLAARRQDLNGKCDRRGRGHPGTEAARAGSGAALNRLRRAGEAARTASDSPAAVTAALETSA